MKKEVYRSYTGPLDAHQQYGYIVCELTDHYQIEYLTVCSDITDRLIRLPKSIIPASVDWAQYLASDSYCALTVDLDNGLIDGGQVFWRGKWYTPKKIVDRNISLARDGKIKPDLNQIYNWRASV